MSKFGLSDCAAQIRGAILEDVYLERLVPRELHGGVVRDIEPFVRVDGDGVSVLQAVCEMAEARGACREPAKSSVDMQPESIVAFQPADSRKIVVVDRVDSSGIGYDRARIVAMFLQKSAQRIDAAREPPAFSFSLCDLVKRRAPPARSAAKGNRFGSA